MSSATPVFAHSLVHFLLSDRPRSISRGFGNPQRGQCHGNMQCPGPNCRGNPNNTVAPGWCPYNLFRTGEPTLPRRRHDIAASVPSLLNTAELSLTRTKAATTTSVSHSPHECVCVHLCCGPLGGDIGPDFEGVMAKLQATIPYQDLKNPISRPGCWACEDPHPHTHAHAKKK